MLKSLVILFCCLSTGLFAQQYRNSVITDPQFGLIKEIKTKPEVTGSVYLYNEWYPANIQLSKEIKGDSKLLENIPIMVDISKNWIEIKTGSDVKVLDVNKADRIELNKDGLIQVFINGRTLKQSQTPVIGLFEVLVEGKTMLLSHVELNYVKANYNMAMDVGEKNDKYVQQRTLFFYDGTRLLKVEKTKKKFLELFPGKTEQIAEYMDKNNLGIKKESDLAKIIDYNNSI